MRPARITAGQAASRFARFFNLPELMNCYFAA